MGISLLKNRVVLFFLFILLVTPLGFQNCSSRYDFTFNPDQLQDQNSLQELVQVHNGVQPLINSTSSTSLKQIVLETTSTENPGKVLILMDNSDGFRTMRSQLNDVAEIMLESLQKLYVNIYLAPITWVGMVAPYDSIISDRAGNSLAPDQIANIDFQTKTLMYHGVASKTQRFLFSPKDPNSSNQSFKKMTDWILQPADGNSSDETPLSNLTHLLLPRSFKNEEPVFFNRGDRLSILLITDEDDQSPLNLTSSSNYMNNILRNLETNVYKLSNTFHQAFTVKAVGWATKITGKAYHTNDGVLIEQEASFLETPVGHFSEEILQNPREGAPCSNTKAVSSQIQSEMDKSKFQTEKCELIEANYSGTVGYNKIPEGGFIEKDVSSFFQANPHQAFSVNPSNFAVMASQIVFYGSPSFFNKFSQPFTFHIEPPIIGTHILESGKLEDHPLWTKFLQDHAINLTEQNIRKSFHSFIKFLLDRNFGTDGYHITLGIIDGKKCIPSSTQSVGTSLMDFAQVLGKNATLVPLCELDSAKSMMSELAQHTIKMTINTFQLPFNINFSEIQSVYLRRDGQKKFLDLKETNIFHYETSLRRFVFVDGYLKADDQLEINLKEHL